MAYRTSARDEHDPVLEVKGDSLARVEVSGQAGLSGANGRSGADGYGAGADGQAGSDAGRAEVGENAGIIHAILKSDPTDRENALLEGTGTSPNGHRRSLSRTVPLGDAGFIGLVFNIRRPVFADVRVSILMFFAISSLTVYGIIMSG